MRSLKIMDGCKGTQVFAINPSGTTTTNTNNGGSGGGVGDKLLHHLQDHLRVNSTRSRSSRSSLSFQSPNPIGNNLVLDTLLPYGLPSSDLLEPQIEPSLKSVDFVETLADVYRRIDHCPQFEKSKMYMEQCAIFGACPIQNCSGGASGRPGSTRSTYTRRWC
ncbi:ethylene-overproduction protein 1 [Prunus yedoensis var. nudiflora]|uniref:Ethylene-overproduction protein 1 n=1 Tax=Prunus yedoensis var. nudiflora TaxID=2094558 RepID=A0A314Z320_PRUYE|nr:ethylene-overproduction protein 1 [Prunus yedoensis var. nudiflora]